MVAILSLFAGARAQADERLDPALAPTAQEDASDISQVYRNMVVVQRKAKQKANRWLFYAYGSFDFSDEPTTMYGINLDVGYAVSDYWEVYLNYVPYFIANQRDIVSKINGLQYPDGTPATLSYAKPKSQIGGEILWAPAYGKDSWGPHSIVRSDTFFKLAVGDVQYEGSSGLRTSLSLGKTFFLSSLFNFRISTGASYIQTVVDSQSKSYVVAIIEAGTIWYF
jgi:hypothetical protein